jgi:heme-degrading monooxygenase HmoA
MASCIAVERVSPLGPKREKGGKENAMPYLLVRHKVEDYERWKPVFDEHGAFREQTGSKGARLWRNANDPNETLILFEWDSMENAQRFTNSDNLREQCSERGLLINQTSTS